MATSFKRSNGNASSDERTYDFAITEEYFPARCPCEREIRFEVLGQFVVSLSPLGLADTVRILLK